MNQKPFLWWVGLALLIFGAFGAIVPPENYPGWYARAWGITHPYTTDGSGSSAGVNAQIWTGRGVKGIGGETRLELDQPALRQEAADADSRVDGRAQHRIWMLFVAMIGLLLMMLGLRQADKEREDRRFRRLSEPPPSPTESGPLSAPSASSQEPGLTAETPYNPFKESPTPETALTSKAPLELLNDDPEPGWWQRLFGRGRRDREERQRPIVVAAPLEPVKIVITLESNGQGTKPAEGEGSQEWKADVKHTLTADLPAMTVHAVEAHLKVGANDTVQSMDLNVR